MTDAYEVERAMAAGLRTVVDPDLPSRVRRRLVRLNPAALPAQCVPGSTPGSEERHMRRVFVVLFAVAVLDIVASAVVTIGPMFGWEYDWSGGLLELFVGQFVVLALLDAGWWVVGAARAVRRRAPVLRRRHAGRYVAVGVLAELWLTGLDLGKLVAAAVRQRDRLARSRACRERWLTPVVDDDAADEVLWHLTQTALATGAVMDAVCDAHGYPELREQAMAGSFDVAAALRTMRADLAWLTTLADTAAGIDAALAAAARDERRRHEREAATEELARRRAALAAARAAYAPRPGDLDAAAAVADYVGHALPARPGNS